MCPRFSQVWDAGYKSDRPWHNKSVVSRNERLMKCSSCIDWTWKRRGGLKMFPFIFAQNSSLIVPSIWASGLQHQLQLPPLCQDLTWGKQQSVSILGCLHRHGDLVHWLSDSHTRSQTNTYVWNSAAPFWMKKMKKCNTEMQEWRKMAEKMID